MSWIKRAGRAAVPTLDEIRTSWPPTCSVPKAADALGISRSFAYEAIGLGQFPVKTLRVGRRVVVVVADLVKVLSADQAGP
jgi:hypothetical protein